MSNPPLDFQQNPVEFVMDALRVARAATEAGASCLCGHPFENHGEADSYAACYYGGNCRCPVYRPKEHIAKFSPLTVIALMEDWLRLHAENEDWRAGIGKFVAPTETRNDNLMAKLAREVRAALAKQG